jgi:exosortase H (IPTLxxWG-CTERM-specific)
VKSEILSRTRQQRRSLSKRPKQPGHPVIRQRPGKFLVLFGAYFLVGYALLMTPWLNPAVITFSRVLVQTSGTLIHLCGGYAYTNGTILRDPSTGLAIEMRDGCNGVSVTILLCSALLAFRASWTQKAKGLLIGCIAIQSVNLLRFITLFYLHQYNRAWFDFAHEYLWESLIMLDAFAVFWLWVQLVLSATAVRDVHA